LTNLTPAIIFKQKDYGGDCVSVKILLPLDASEGAMAAVDYVARIFGRTPDVHITLLHILPGLPAAFWDDGHILTEEEQGDRQRLINIWENKQAKAWKEVFQKAQKRLLEGGLSPKAVKTKFKPMEFNVADDIMNVAEAGRYDAIVLGRRGQTGLKKILLGSVAARIVHYAKNRAVTIVE
jgi:nucleotide-binding universal stress UspA family protein